MKRKVAVLLSPWFIDYVSRFLNGLQNVCKDKDIDIHVFAAYKFSELSGEPNITGFSIFDLIDYKDYDGVILLSRLFNDDEIAAKEVEKIRKAGIQAVSISAEYPGVHFIYNEDFDECKKLILHLIRDHKVRKFAFIGGPSDNSSPTDNLAAFYGVLASENIEINPDDIYLGGDYSYNFAYEQANKIFDKKENLPQAVVCINDNAAMAAITSAAEHGLNVPSDVIIIGHDDIDFADKVIPSITTINTMSEKLAEAAIETILSKPKTPIRKEISSHICYRQSCGCEKTVNPSQIAFNQHFTKDIDREQRFASLLRLMEDHFIKDNTIDELTDTLQDYFTIYNNFEGKNFAILLNKNVVDSFNDTSSNKDKNTKLDNKLYVLTNIADGKAAKAGGIIKTSDLMPDSLKADGSNIYLYLPIFNNKFIYGYYVSKNNYNLLLKKSAYNWTRNFGTILEKFRTTAYYRYISEQYRQLSITDAVSGLLNRSGMNMFGIKLFDKNNKDNRKTVIEFIDINQMKYINDKFGHLQGDLAIKTVAEAIKASIPRDYLAIRYGGDEFVIIGTGKLIKPVDNANAIVTKIRNFIEAEETKMNLPYHITISCGTKVFNPKENALLSDAINEVDDIMYIEKKEFHKKLGK